MKIVSFSLRPLTHHLVQTLGFPRSGCVLAHRHAYATVLLQDNMARLGVCRVYRCVAE